MTKKQLSNDSQKIWDAFNDVSERVGVFEDYGDALASAIYTMADIVLLEFSNRVDDEVRKEIMRKMRDIAAELEG